MEKKLIELGFLKGFGGYYRELKNGVMIDVFINHHNNLLVYIDETCLNSNASPEWIEKLIKLLENEEKPLIKMKFKDAPIGARFKYPESDKIWVKINSYPKGKFNDGNGLIVRWNGNIEGYQSHCSFVDENEGIDFDTEVELTY